MSPDFKSRMAALRSGTELDYASRSEAAYGMLRTAVMDGLLQPGQRLREIDARDFRADRACNAFDFDRMAHVSRRPLSVKP